MAKCSGSFVPSLSIDPFLLDLSASLKHGLTAGHICSIKEMEHVVAVTARDTSDQPRQPHQP